MMPLRSSAPLALLLLLCSACADSEEPRERYKLVDQSQGVLAKLASTDGGARELLNSDGPDGFAGYALLGDMNDPSGGAKGLIEQRLEQDELGSYLTLSGQSGGAYCLVEAKPNTYYSFSAQVRVESLELGSGDFHGATPWIAEMTKRGSVQELFPRGPQGGVSQEYVYHREQFPTGLPGEGWKERSRIFVTGPETQMLLVTFRLAYTAKLESGEVSFRSVKLEEVPRQEYWQARLDWAVGVRSAGTELADDWRFQRVVRGNLGGELRPAIVLLPGESLSFKLPVPHSAPRFESGVGFWDPSLNRGGAKAQTFRVSVKGAAGSAHQKLEQLASGDRSDTRWSPLSLDLTPHAGAEVELTLSLEGEVPGMFGAPQVLSTRPAERLPNVVLISIDTLRADHVGAYGATEDQTPHLDAFAKQGILFANMTGQAPYTLPGHATILSGQHPGVHGLQQPGQLLSPVRSPILTRILSERGYATQAFTGGGFVNAEFGFARDFDGFVNIDPWRHRGSAHFAYLISQTPEPIKRVSRAADQGLYITQEMVDEYGPEGVKRWITKHKEEPFFLFVHSFSIHDYEPPPGYLNCADRGCSSERKDYSDFKLKNTSNWQGLEISEADKQHLKHRYDATLRYTDERFGELMAHLDSLGLAEDTIVIVTTDHGEEMFERGFIQHGKSLYEELTRIPLIMRIPGVEPRVVDAPAMQIDILPTLLGAMDIEPDERIQGIDLLKESQAERATWSEIDDDFVELYSYRSADNWKLIHAPDNPSVRFQMPVEWQLFNLNEDPGETRNLAESEPERLAELRQILERKRSLHQDLSAPYAHIQGSRMTKSTEEALRQLGYMGDDEEEEEGGGD